jgi:hypothetical protein
MATPQEVLSGKCAANIEITDDSVREVKVIRFEERDQTPFIP